MQYTSRQRQAVFMKARVTRVLKNHQQLDLYLKDQPEIKRKVEDYHRRHPYDDGMQWFDPGFMVETKEDYRRAEDLLEQRLQIASDYAGYSIYDLDQKGTYRMQLTSAGTTLVSIVCLIVFVIAFRYFLRTEEVRSCHSSFVRMIGYLVVLLKALLFSMLALVLMLSLALFNMHISREDYRTIYSNDLKATVSFKTDPDEREFVGGQKVKEISDRHSGTLTLSKDGVKVTKSIDEVEYLGDVEKGSIVEKIEYSNSLRETKVFGVSLMQMKENCLKIHLKKTASQTAKDKKDAQTKKELNSLLDSDK